MTYKINGTDLTLQPETGQWNAQRSSYGTDGGGHGIFPRAHTFEMKWSFMSMAEFNQLYNFYLTTSVTGTAVAMLPEYGAATYQFREYSGTVLQEPESGAFFEEYVSDVRLVINRIIVA